MDWLGWVILGEGLNLTTMTLRSLLWCETHVSMTWCRKLTMRLLGDGKCVLVSVQFDLMDFYKQIHSVNYLLTMIN